MGLSRRIFSKEFKLAAVQRLERGEFDRRGGTGAGGEPEGAARWRREIREGPGNVFPDQGKQRWADGRIADWYARSASRPWRSIF
jgi:hypothetical protein